VFTLNISKGVPKITKSYKSNKYRNFLLACVRRKCSLANTCSSKAYDRSAWCIEFRTGSILFSGSHPPDFASWRFSLTWKPTSFGRGHVPVGLCPQASTQKKSAVLSKNRG